jgi:phosphoglycerol transferase MdoB-like AlkP superfamily enzyme
MTWHKVRQSLLGPAQGWRWPVYVALGLYVTVSLSFRYLLGIPMGQLTAMVDLPVVVAIALLCFAMSRRVWPFVLFMMLYFALFYFASAAMIKVLGRPIMPDEIVNLRALVMILGPLGWVGIGLPLAIFVAAWLFNLTWKTRRAKAALAVTVAVPLAVTAFPAPILAGLDGLTSNAPWDQNINFYTRGGSVHFLQETVRLLAQRTPPPGEAEVAAAAARLDAAAQQAPQLPAGRTRNVHLFLLESFWDPQVLTAAHFSAPVMDPRFEALWRQSGYSQGLSPAFGGQTANAEYEMLCGFPTHQHAVNFEYGIKRDVPCLPEFLRRAGYRTVASHPNRGSFWNRSNVYRRIGFETFWDQEALDLSGTDGYLLTDKEQFRQVQELIRRSADNRPLFNFVLTIEGHWNYSTAPDRQAGIRSDSRVPDVHQFANVMYFKSRDVMDIVEELRASDPDSLIIVFGDHLPLLGNSYEGYVESGLLPASSGAFDKDQYDFSTRTPMVVIDGRNGPLDLGARPMFEMPAIIAALLGRSEPAIFRFTRPPAGLDVRPLPGVNLAYENGAPVELCRAAGQSSRCEGVAAWMRDVQLVEHDLFRGDQYALKLLAAPGGDTLAHAATE